MSYPEYDPDEAFSGPPAAMTAALDAIRARHVKHDDWYCENGERIPEGQDSCDAAQLLAALDRAEAAGKAAADTLETLAADLVNDHRGIPYDVVSRIDGVVEALRALR